VLFFPSRYEQVFQYANERRNRKRRRKGEDVEDISDPPAQTQRGRITWWNRSSSSEDILCEDDVTVGSSSQEYGMSTLGLI
jgi:hypothetical protein